MQRVSEASVEVDGAIVGAVGPGLLVLLGMAEGDDAAAVEALAAKIARLRVFPDAEGRLARSLVDTRGAALVVSQFTLVADSRRTKGTRPSFTRAAPPATAAPLVTSFCDALRSLEVPVATGVFGAHMRVALVNDGPVTVVLDAGRHP